jgi:hypothetical protein
MPVRLGRALSVEHPIQLITLNPLKTETRESMKKQERDVMIAKEKAA